MTCERLPAIFVGGVQLACEELVWEKMDFHCSA